MILFRFFATLVLSVVLISPAGANNVGNLSASSEELSQISTGLSPEEARAAAFNGHQTMMGQSSAELGMGPGGVPLPDAVKCNSRPGECQYGLIIMII